MRKNKIWLLLDSSESGGIESHVFQLAEGLKKHGQQVEVIFLTDYGKHPMRDALLEHGINSTTLDGRFKTLLIKLNTELPTVLHTHGYKAGLFGRIAAWKCNIPSVSTYHAGEIPTGKLALYDWLDRVSAGLAAKRFAVSPQIAKRLAVKSDVFNNFVNSTNLKASRGDQIAFVGRVSKEKGPDHFVSLAVQFPEIEFHLYGDGPQLLEMQTTSPVNLILHGQQHDMSKVWPKIGLLIMPSRFEGLPMAALEAMARGIPVLAFNVGALHRLIDSHNNGWLIEAGNISDLAKYIDLWNCYSEQRKSLMRSACKKTIKENFCSDIAIPKLIKSYKQAAFNK